MTSTKLFAAALCASALFVSACSREGAVGLEPQFGSPRDDYADVVTTDAARGRVYLAGAHVGPANTGRGGVLFFRRYTRGGRLVWKRSANAERPGVYVSATDADTDAAGNVYFSWYTAETVGDTYTVRRFIGKYDPAGTLVFELVRDPVVDGLTVDGAGNIYTAGSGSVRKYGGDGRLLWERGAAYLGGSAGGDLEIVSDLEITPDGTLYVAGSDRGHRGYLIRLRGGDGVRLGVTPVNGVMLDISVGGSSVYLFGEFERSGGVRSVINRLRRDGTFVWEHVGPYQSLGEQSPVEYEDVTADAQGNAYLAGTAYSDPTNEGYLSDRDCFVRKYLPSGAAALTRRFENPDVNAVCARLEALSAGELYAAGSTDGAVDGKNYGGGDAFLMRLNGQAQKVWER